MKKIINNKLNDLAKKILSTAFEFSQEKVELSEIDKLLTEWESKGEENVRIKQYSYCLSVIEVIRVIANGEMGIPMNDRLKLIEIITETLRGNLNNNDTIIEVDFTNKTIM